MSIFRFHSPKQRPNPFRFHIDNLLRDTATINSSTDDFEELMKLRNSLVRLEKNMHQIEGIIDPNDRDTLKQLDVLFRSCYVKLAKHFGEDIEGKYQAELEAIAEEVFVDPKFSRPPILELFGDHPIEIAKKDQLSRISNDWRFLDSRLNDNGHFFNLSAIGAGLLGSIAVAAITFSIIGLASGLGFFGAALMLGTAVCALYLLKAASYSLHVERRFIHNTLQDEITNDVRSIIEFIESENDGIEQDLTEVASASAPAASNLYPVFP